jgi:phosphatidylglycerophosphate synthase
MNAPSAPAPGASVESTYKARDLEGFLDIYFYRPIGYVLAVFFAKLRFTPSMVSLLGAAIGIVAGHLYYYRDLRVNIAGMALHMLTNALDNADGQLARLTNRGSLQGAITDGFADYVVFLSVYIHLCLRHMAEGGSAAVWLLALGAGASHAIQSMMIDFYRYGYLQFVMGKQSLDANASETVRKEYEAASWRQFFKKLGLRNYLNYTRQQEALSPDLVRLRLGTRAGIPDWLPLGYRAACRPLVKWCNLLATNARMLLLFALLFLAQPVWYFAVELTILNAILAFVLLRHNAIFGSLLARLQRTA